VLVDASLTTDQAAARKWEVHRSTIYRWREKLEEDPALQRLTTKYWKQAREADSWVQDATRTIRSAQAFIRDAANEMDPSDPHAVEAMTEALQTITDALQMARIVDARLGTSRQNGAASEQDAPQRLQN